MRFFSEPECPCYVAAFVWALLTAKQILKIFVINVAVVTIALGVLAGLLWLYIKHGF